MNKKLQCLATGLLLCSINANAPTKVEEAFSAITHKVCASQDLIGIEAVSMMKLCEKYSEDEKKALISQLANFFINTLKEKKHIILQVDIFVDCLTNANGDINSLRDWILRWLYVNFEMHKQLLNPIEENKA